MNTTTFTTLTGAVPASRPAGVPHRAGTERLDRLAHWLDTRFSLFGVRFGLDGIVGLVPGVGDVAGLAISAFIIGEGWRMGARRRTLVRMVLNVLADTLVGMVPVLGMVADVAWKANRANMRLLRRDLERPARA